MLLTPSFQQAMPNRMHIWVLAPSIAAADENIRYYYDFSQSIAEYQAVFETLQLPWTWQPVTLNDYQQVIEHIAEQSKNQLSVPVILNLCDGDEVNGAPGLSVVHCLEQHNLIYTGADAYFYEVTTSKIPMKKAFDAAGLSHAAWSIIRKSTIRTDKLFEKVGSPLIVKPAVSGGSMGLGVRNVVENTDQLKTLLKELFSGYRGWDLTSDGLIAESFIRGREFTLLISGSYDDRNSATIYDPVERVFHQSLPPNEQFLSFDRLWETYEQESAMPNEENFYEYRQPEESLWEPLKQISWDAYVATKGKGYTRVDVRMDEQTGRLYVLEVNAQCGLSEDENFTSIGAILRFANQSFSQLILEILHDAWCRFERKQQQLANSRIARA